MKKVLMFLVVAMLSIVSVMAVERTVKLSSPDFLALYNQSKFAEAKAYLDTCVITTQLDKWLAARYYYGADVKANGKQATPELVLTKVQEYITLVGLTDPDMIMHAKLQALSHHGFYVEAIALSKDSQGKMVQSYMYHIYYAAKDYEKAYAAAIATANKHFAFLAVCKIDKVRAFEAAKALTLNSYVTPIVLTEVLDKLGTFNYRDSAITKDMEIAFLADLNEKYSRFLIKDKSLWEPVIAMIRLSLEVKRSSK